MGEEREMGWRGFMTTVIMGQDDNESGSGR